MKVQHNITVYAGDTTQNGAQAQADKTRENSARDGKNETIYAGNFLADRTLRDRIQQKKAQAQERALKIVDDAWNGDKQLDEEINRHKERLSELKEDYRESRDIRKTREIEMENAIIRGIREERRKAHPMVDAQKQAEDVLEAARSEVIGMVTEAAKEKLDEDQEDRKEEAEAIREERKEQEELQEKRDEREKELEELLEEMPVEEAANLENVQAQIRQQIQNIVNQAGLVAEDIKGSMVDANV